MPAPYSDGQFLHGSDVNLLAPRDSPTFTTVVTLGASGTNVLTLTPGITSSTDTTFVLAGTGNLYHMGTFKAQNFLTPGQTHTLTGALFTPIAKFTGNLTGPAGGAPNTVFDFRISSDTADTTGVSSGGFPGLMLTRSIGGTGTKGGRSGIRSSVNISTAYVDTTTPQFVSMEQWIQASASVGGTLSSPAGALYSNNPQVTINPGATFWSVANALGESDIAINGSTQPLTLGGSVTAGDTLTVTFTSTSITGSPVSVTATAGTSDTLSILSQKLIAAINSNASLTAADIAAAGSGTTFGLYWPAQNTVTPSVAVAGAATETMTLGTFVAGGSVGTKLGASFVRLGPGDSARGFISDAAMVFTGQNTSPVSGQWTRGIVFGGDNDGAQFPIMATGSLILTSVQNSYGGSNKVAWLTQSYAAYGIDFRTLNTSAAGGRSLAVAGWDVDGFGTNNISNAQIGPIAGGIKIDVSGQRGTAAIAHGGSGVAGNINNRYYPNDLIYDPFGGQYVVSTVDQSIGSVTGLTTIIAPYVQGTPPSNPVSTTGGSGAGLTLTITWAANNTLSLNPSGGAVKFGSGCFTANGAVATALSSVGPTGSHTTVQEWLTFTNASGTVRYIPAF